jgi:hypothetical protein
MYIYINRYIDTYAQKILYIKVKGEGLGVLVYNNNSCGDSTSNSSALSLIGKDDPINTYSKLLIHIYAYSRFCILRLGGKG